jgi:hypothetical protein
MVYMAYPKKARSFSAVTGSALSKWSDMPPSSSSSVGKYDVSVIDSSLGTNGGSICRIVFQSAPRKNGWLLISLTVILLSAQSIMLLGTVSPDREVFH